MKMEEIQGMHTSQYLSPSEFKLFWLKIVREERLYFSQEIRIRRKVDEKKSDISSLVLFAIWKQNKEYVGIHQKAWGDINEAQA